ncbi:MAG: geranylgeranyl reductase family protein [Fibrobacterota bacterium]
MKLPVRDAYDIVIVGGGPAGAMAAKTAAEQGVSVLMLEKDKEIGLPVRCGELVGKRGLTLAINPDPAWITHEMQGVCFVSPTGIRINVPCPEPAYMLDRPRMEKDIAHMAAKKGADFLVRACAVDLVFGKTGDVTGVTFLYSGERVTVRSKIVIAADGVESRMAKLAGIDSTITNLNDIGICAQYRVTNIDSPEGFPELHFGKNIVPDCYAWMFPKGDGTFNLGLGIRASSAKDESPVQLLNKFIRLRYPTARPLGLTVGAVPLGLYLSRLVCNGFMVVGDAARMANCLDGGGITYAMNAAKIAAAVAAEAIKAGDVSAKKLSLYEKRWKGGIGKQQERTYKLKDAVLKVKDSTIESAAQALQKRDPAKLKYLDIVKATVKNQPSLIFEAARLFK